MAVKALAQIVNFNAVNEDLDFMAEIKIAAGQEGATVQLGPFPAGSGPLQFKAAIQEYTSEEWDTQWGLLDTVNLLGEGLI